MYDVVDGSPKDIECGLRECVTHERRTRKRFLSPSSPFSLPRESVLAKIRTGRQVGKHRVRHFTTEQ